MFIGCHLSISNGIHNCIEEIESIGGTAFQIFLRNPKSLSYNEFSNKKIQELKQLSTKLSESNDDGNKIKAVIHCPYVLNFCNIDTNVYNSSVEILKSDLEYANIANIQYCIIHVGKNTGKLPFEVAISNFASGIAKVLNETTHLNSKIVVETAAGQGNEICWKLKNLGRLRDFVYEKLIDKTQINRLKYCIDTCHITSANYDIINDCDRIINLIGKYLKWENVVCVHVNDNKGQIGCFVDRHEDIGYGTLGTDAILNFIHKIYKINNNIIFILETPQTHSSITTQINLIKQKFMK